MIVLNNIPDRVRINILDCNNSDESNYQPKNNSINLDPGDITKIDFRPGQTMYVYSKSNVERMDKASHHMLYADEMHETSKLMIAEKYYTAVRVHDCKLSDEFLPDIVFAVSYMTPDEIPNTYNAVMFLIILSFIIIIISGLIIGITIQTKFLNKRLNK